MDASLPEDQLNESNVDVRSRRAYSRVSTAVREPLWDRTRTVSLTLQLDAGAGSPSGDVAEGKIGICIASCLHHRPACHCRCHLADPRQEYGALFIAVFLTGRSRGLTAGVTIRHPRYGTVGRLALSSTANYGYPLRLDEPDMQLHCRFSSSRRC